jgi:hypothetical protein
VIYQRTVANLIYIKKKNIIIMKKNEITPEEITESIPAGAVSILEVVKDEETTYKCYLRDTDVKVITTAMNQMRIQGENFNMILIGETILRSLWISGDLEILDNEKVRMSASIQAFSLIEIMSSSLKKI